MKLSYLLMLLSFAHFLYSIFPLEIQAFLFRRDGAAESIPADTIKQMFVQSVSFSSKFTVIYVWFSLSFILLCCAFCFPVPSFLLESDFLEILSVWGYEKESWVPSSKREREREGEDDSFLSVWVLRLNSIKGGKTRKSEMTKLKCYLLLGVFSLYTTRKLETPPNCTQTNIAQTKTINK